MCAWVTEEVLRWTVRLCSRRPQWTQCSFLVTASVSNASFPGRAAHIWGTRENQTSLARGLVGSVRFFTQHQDHPEEEQKELLSPPLADILPPADIQLNIRTPPFLDKLQLCSSPSDVLDLNSEYALTVHQDSLCLGRMWFITKRLSEEQRRYERQLMFEHPAFNKLLQKVMNNVNNMYSKDVAHSLLSMVKLGVPQRSRVVQTLLRYCQENLNHFDEKSLSILSSCLLHMEKSPSVLALKKGMRLVVEARLPRIENVLALQTIMRVLGKDCPLDLKQKLERKALSMTDQFSLPNTQNMICTMAMLGLHSKPLLNVCSKKLTENLPGIPYNKMLTVLQSCKELHYRDLDLLNGISDHVTSMLDIWTFRKVLLFMDEFYNLRFCPEALLEPIAERLIANPDILTLKDLLCVLKVFASFNYDVQHHRQQLLDTLSQVLDSYLPKIPNFLLLMSVFHLCVLGHFPSVPLERLLQSSIIEQLQNTLFLQNQKRMFQVVDQCLRLDRPPLPRPLTVPPSLLGHPSSDRPSVKPLLSQSLRSVLGDRADTMLQEMVMVDNYFIDAVITKAVPNQSSVPEASAGEAAELSPAESSHRVAVICPLRSSICYGTSKPRGPLAVKIRHLKILGFNPVLVTEQELQPLSKDQRTEFLRSLIFPQHHRSDTEDPEDRSQR